MGIARQLEDVLRDLTPLAEQGKVVGFLANVKNTGKISSLIEDIRNAIMGYQVCIKLFNLSHV